VRTIERPSATPAGPPAPGGEPAGSRRADVLALVLGLLGLPVLAFAVLSRWGVIAALFLLFLASLGIFAARKGFLFVEMVGFLIHFDGIGLGPVRAGRILAAVALGVVLWKLVVEKWRPPAIPVRHWLPPMGVMIVAVASGAWAAEAGQWLFQMGLLGLAVALFSVTGLLVDSHEKVMRYLRAFWIGGLFGAANGVVSLFLGGRSEGFGGDPNYFGLLQASMIPLTIYYRRNARTPREKLLYSFVLVYVFAAAAGAGSRSGALGAALALVAAMVTKPGLSSGRRIRTGVIAVLCGGGAFLALFFLNPANAARGFGDRGAGRLDFWTTAVSLVEDQPLFGYGFGQLKVLIPQNLASTPGVQELDEVRTEVSSHNTFLDIMGDLGVAGLVFWVAIFVVTIVGFLRPRWAQVREVSMTMAVMMVPILSGMMLLPLLNNKLAWSLIGLSAALQVPSKGARWRGYAGAERRRRASVTSGSGPASVTSGSGPASVTSGSGPASVTSGSGPDSGDDGAVDDRPLPVLASRPGRPPRIHPFERETWTSPALARWDLRISQRFRRLIIAGGLAGAVVFGTVASSLPAQYVASAGIVMPGLEDSAGSRRIVVSEEAVQGIHAIVNSGAYAQALQRLSGVDLTIPQVEDRVDVLRPDFAAYMDIRFTDSDQAVSEQVLPYLVAALDEVIAEGRRASVDQVADEVRPVFPGEQRFYTGAIYYPVSDEAFVELVPRPVVWAGIVGAMTGALVALAFVLYQQRRPRVNNDDDLDTELGLSVWAHVARLGRRFAASADQFAQVPAAALDRSPVDEGLPGVDGADLTRVRRIVVTTPRPDRAARGLAVGVAASLAASGQRVVFVDAQVDRPAISWRLAPFRRRGLVQVSSGECSLGSVIRRVPRMLLPVAVRRTLGRSGDLLRFVPAGWFRPGEQPVVRPQVLDPLGDDVVVVVLAPSLLSGVSAGPWLHWAEACVLTLVEGRTVTFDAEDAAERIRSLSAEPHGIVMLDV
jgi:O-antigen ligase/Mrp family chromosome partitioning ATPase